MPASPAASAAYLTVSELFPVAMRGLAIALPQSGNARTDAKGRFRIASVPADTLAAALDRDA